ncbi:MAG: hypothetical protein WC256_12370 [Desulfurivibrionaceae bacterium]|jgi:hypothetical protein
MKNFKTAVSMLTLVGIAMSMTACSSVKYVKPIPEGTEMVKLSDANDCQDKYGAVWSYESDKIYTSQEDAQVFIDKLNAEKYLGFSDWRLPSVYDMQRHHRYSMTKKTGDCKLDDKKSYFTSEYSKPLRIITVHLTCGPDDLKEIDNRGKGYVRGVRID